MAVILVNNVEQVKAHSSNISGCGGFQLPHNVEELEHYYEIEQEITIYLDVDDLIRRVRYYLNYEDERQVIAGRGYQRTLAEHTYAQRFKSVFARMGLTNE